MNLHRTIARRHFDERLTGLEQKVGPRPLQGWVRAIRDSLGMSEFELGERMGVSQPRVSQIQRAEAGGSIQLATLDRAARALNCRLVYFLAPQEMLEEMVWRQALVKAAEAVGDVGSALWDDEGDVGGDDDEGLLELEAEQLDAVAHSFVDRRGLWRSPQPAARAGPVPPGPPPASASGLGAP